ncbi:TonB-dependent receptor [Erythrobacter sp. MTPC3]|uniref:TonB-dependent receptor n=1 Tax=Erythrobacter sp. MTPC3 TaxID=3056564 RepID=UPI0036F27A75
MRKTATKLMVSASIGAIAMTGHSAAFAQESEAAEEDGNIIIVTANKREQNLQDVSSSIQAFDAEALDQAGITDVSRLELVTSGVNFSFTGNDAKFNVRGANSSNTFGDNSSIVGAFVDGVYKARASQQTRAFFDVERVEFLKGPQGTLYGRNTFAGALNLTTNKPELGDFGAGVEVGYERFDTFRGEGYINVPLGDNLAIRGAGYITKSDGYIENLAGPDIGQQDDKGFRVSLLWEASDNFDLIARVQHSEEDGREAGLFGYTFLCRGVTPSGHTDAFGSQQDCQNPNRGSGGVNAPFAANSGQPNTGPYIIEQDYVPDVDLKETVLSLEMNLDLGAVSVKSITSYTDFQNLFGFDFDFSAQPHAIGGFDETLEGFSQELNFNTDFDGPFNLTAGAYYSVEDTFFSFSIYNQTPRAARAGAVPVLNNASQPVLDGNGDPLLLPVLTSTPLTTLDRSFNGFFADSAFIETETIGLFAQGTLEVSESLRIVGGLRYSSEEKTLEGGGSNFTANGPVTVIPEFGAGAAPIILPDSRDVFAINRNAAGAATGNETFDNVDYRATIEYDINPDVLLYATTATGFLSGVINNNGTTTDQQESVVYEVGLKSVLADGTLTFNLAGYYTEYSNLLAQFQVIDPNTGIGVTFSENSGTIDVYGVDLEAIWSPTPDFTLTAIAAYVSSEYGDFGQTSPYQLNNGTQDLFVDLSGETTTFSPEFTLTLAASYVIDLGEFGTLTPIGQFYYSDGFNTSNLFAIDPAAQQDSFTKSDLRLVWDSEDGDYSVEAFVENIEDEAVLSRSNNNGGDDLLQSSFLFPRNYGVRFRANF